MEYGIIGHANGGMSMAYRKYIICLVGVIAICLACVFLPDYRSVEANLDMFFTELKEGDKSALSYVAHAYNTRVRFTGDLKEDMESAFQSELVQQRFQILLQDAEFEVEKLTSEQKRALDQNQTCTITVNAKVRLWDDTLPYVTVTHILENNPGYLSSVLREPQSLNELYAQVREEVPLAEVTFEMQVVTNRDGGYAFTCEDFFDTLHISDSLSVIDKGGLNIAIYPNFVDTILDYQLGTNQTMAYEAFQHYNTMIDEQSFDISLIYHEVKDLLNEQDSYYQPIETAINWYNEQDDATKQSINEIYVNNGKLDYLYYGNYNQYTYALANAMLMYKVKDPLVENETYHTYSGSELTIDEGVAHLFDPLISAYQTANPAS